LQLAGGLYQHAPGRGLDPAKDQVMLDQEIWRFATSQGRGRTSAGEAENGFEMLALT